MHLHTNILGNGTPFLILHGFLGMGDNWKTLGKQFSDAGYQVHLIDQRNHGRSPHSNNFNYDLLAQDIKDYCEQHHLKEVVLLGHSMGGKVAMLTACKHPNLVSKLIVADITPRYYPPHHHEILNGLDSLDFSTIKNRNDADAQLAAYIDNVGIRQFLLKNLYRKTKNEFALRINLAVLKNSMEEIGEALPTHINFNKETLFLRGDKSEYITQQDEQIIKQHFPLAKIVTIKNAGHWLHAENPTQFYKTVTQFIIK